MRADEPKPCQAYDAEGREIEPNLREHGARSLEATCEVCKHEAVVNVDGLPDELYAPDLALRLRCSSCSSKKITTRPNGTHTKPMAEAGRPRRSSKAGKLACERLRRFTPG